MPKKVFHNVLSITWKNKKKRSGNRNSSNSKRNRRIEVQEKWNYFMNASRTKNLKEKC